MQLFEKYIVCAPIHKIFAQSFLQKIVCSPSCCSSPSALLPSLVEILLVAKNPAPSYLSNCCHYGLVHHHICQIVFITGLSDLSSCCHQCHLQLLVQSVYNHHCLWSTFIAISSLASLLICSRATLKSNYYMCKFIFGRFI